MFILQSTSLLGAFRVFNLVPCTLCFRNMEQRDITLLELFYAIRVAVLLFIADSIPIAQVAE